jgi:hypothetical protein
VDELAGPAVHQREHGGDGGVGRRAERQRLDEGDPQREAGFRIVGKRLPGRAVDQRIDIEQPPKSFRSDGMGEAAIVGTFEIACGNVERSLKRQALSKHRIEQAQGRNGDWENKGIAWDF